jgi:hypothetical protein
MACEDVEEALLFRIRTHQPSIRGLARTVESRWNGTAVEQCDRARPLITQAATFLPKPHRVLSPGLRWTSSGGSARLTLQPLDT